MATAGGKKIVSNYAIRQESSNTSIRIFKNNRYKKKKINKRKKVGVGAKKQSSR